MNLRIGAKGKNLADLQNLLNNKVIPRPNLRTDGEFGQKTRNAVIQFQHSNWLVGDGIVGPCTWNCITGKEKYHVLHPVHLVPQSTPVTCWAAATAMLLGQPLPVTLPAAVKKLIDDGGGGVLNDSKLNDPFHMKIYCNHFKLKLHNPQSYIPDALYDLLQRRPLMASILWNSASYTGGNGSSGHAVIITGIRGNGEAHATTLRIIDPLPVGIGSVRSFNYAKLMNDFPAFTYHLIQRI